MVTSRRDNYHAHFPIKFYLQFEGQLANVWERCPQHTPMSGPLRSQYCLLRAGSWASLVACKGHAQTVRARYLVGGREQVRQAGTQKKAPVRRRGPHAVRRRSREQVNRTPEGETETTWQECRGADKSGGLFKQSPSTRCYHWDNSSQQCPVRPTRRQWRACTKGIWAGGREKSGNPSANPSSVPGQLWPQWMRLLNGRGLPGETQDS